jgi:hypothetical protein
MQRSKQQESDSQAVVTRYEDEDDEVEEVKPPSPAKQPDTEREEPLTIIDMEAPLITTTPTEYGDINFTPLDLNMQLVQRAWTCLDQLKYLKEYQSRIAAKRKNACLAALIYILCRQAGVPRTFNEIGAVLGVTKNEIGKNYRWLTRLVHPNAYSSPPFRPYAYMERWTHVLNTTYHMPDYVLPLAAFICTKANDFYAVFAGKCPTSVASTCLWSAIWYINHSKTLLPSVHNQEKYEKVLELILRERNDAEQEQLSNHISVGLKDIARITGVATATIMLGFRSLAAGWRELLPVDMMQELAQGTKGDALNKLVHEYQPLLT